MDEHTDKVEVVSRLKSNGREDKLFFLPPCMSYIVPKLQSGISAALALLVVYDDCRHENSIC